MDPVQLPKLLDVADRLVSRSGPLTIDDLDAIQGISKRRFAEIARVLEGIGIAMRDGFSLEATRGMQDFVRCWEAADLECINRFFTLYAPYRRFLNFLEQERLVRIPPRNDSIARKALGVELRNKAKLTFVAVDTFKWWGMAVGKVYISQLESGDIYWGGENPTLEQFEESVIRHYFDIRRLDSFVKVGQLADRVCRELRIAFIRFEGLLKELCLQQPDRFLTSTSLARQPSGRFLVQTILPRAEARQRNEDLQPGRRIEWTEKRYVDDGIFIGGRSVKMIRVSGGEGR